MNFQQHRLLMESTDIEDRSEWGVLVALIYFADKETAQAWPGMEKLAAKARMTVRGVEKVLGRLIGAGFVAVAETGGGKCKTTVFQVQIEQGSRGQTPNPVRGLEEPNPEPHSVNGVPKPSHTPNGVREIGGYTPNPVRNSISIPRTPFAPHIEESKKRNEEFSGGGSGEENGEALRQPPAAIPNLNSNSDSPTLRSPIARAIFEINGRAPNLRNGRDAQEMQSLARLLEPFVCEEAAAAEIARRFSLWDKATPPQLSQIVSDWERMERVARLAKRREERQGETPNADNDPAQERRAEGRRLRSLAYANSGNPAPEHLPDGRGGS